jgi:hypothetical protein
LTSSISPVATRCASSANVRSSSEFWIEFAIRQITREIGEELLLLPHLQRLAGRIPPFVVETPDEHRGCAPSCTASSIVDRSRSVFSVARSAPYARGRASTPSRRASTARQSCVSCEAWFRTRRASRQSSQSISVSPDGGGSCIETASALAGKRREVSSREGHRRSMRCLGSVGRPKEYSSALPDSLQRGRVQSLG